MFKKKLLFLLFASLTHAPYKYCLFIFREIRREIFAETNGNYRNAIAYIRIYIYNTPLKTACKYVFVFFFSLFLTFYVHSVRYDRLENKNIIYNTNSNYESLLFAAVIPPRHNVTLQQQYKTRANFSLSQHMNSFANSRVLVKTERLVISTRRTCAQPYSRLNRKSEMRNFEITYTRKSNSKIYSGSRDTLLH